MSSNNITDLQNLMAKLRDPQDGCPWDLEQDFDSIAGYTIEEAYEVADSIIRKDHEHLKEELGDLLFQVIFHSQLASEQNLFNFNDVVDNIYKKMVSRHPHIFGKVKKIIENAAAQEEAWELYKQQERKDKKLEDDSLLSNIPENLPAIKRAYKLQKRAASVGFDWPDVKGCMAKVHEEISELEDAIKTNSNIKDELGDVFFALVNVARKLGTDPETALLETNNKFSKRFRYLENEIRKDGKDLKSSSLEEMDQLWK